jgi:uncharacterized protein (DUF1015 family)
MAVIRPFSGLRYTPAAGPLEALVAPPYDVISPDEREEFVHRSEHNVVHLTLPEQKDDDRSKFVKYARSAAALAEWRREGLIAAEKVPAFYRYTQTFTIPGSLAPHVRNALIALIKVEPYEKGVVLPHEQTFPKHKEDRLRILEATRSHLECIFGLFEDEGGQTFRQIAQAHVTPAADVTTDDGVRHVLELITDPAEIATLERQLSDKKVWIADGHHRYETAMAFRQTLGERSELIAEDFMMMALSSMSDPGLVLLPTHRIVKQMPVTGTELEKIMTPYFTVERTANERLLHELGARNEDNLRAFGVALSGEEGLLLTLNPARKALTWIAGIGSDRLKLLDVSILHEVIFDKLLGLKGLEFFSYTRDPDEALNAVQNGSGAAFLMNPPTVEDMRQIALGGEKMPQKSTYYYPKILSGLVLWSLNDFAK